MWAKIRDYVIGFVFISFIILGLLVAHERHSAAKAKGEAKEALAVAQNNAQELQKAQLSYRVDLDAIHNAQDTKDNLVANATAVKEKVDAVAKKVASGQMSDSSADDAYYDSMLEVYCQGASDVEACTKSTRTGH